MAADADRAKRARVLDCILYGVLGFLMMMVVLLLVKGFAGVVASSTSDVRFVLPEKRYRRSATSLGSSECDSRGLA